MNRIASDVLFFTTKETNFFRISDEFLSGSSVMPQKKNVDVAELLRSKAKSVLGAYLHVATIPLDLLSGYNRDLQDMKKPLLESLEVTRSALQTAKLLMTGLVPLKDNLAQACTPEMYATHAAYDLVGKGSSFRDAYRQIADGLDNLQIQRPERMLRLSNHRGGTGNLGIKKLKQTISRETAQSAKKRVRLQQTWEKLKLSSAMTV